MERLQAYRLESRHLGERITAHPVDPESGFTLSTVVQGELLAFDAGLGQMVLTIGLGGGSAPVEVLVKTLSEVRIDLY